MVLLFFSLALFLSDSSKILVSGKEVSPESLMTLVNSADVVFLGEKHDDTFAHRCEIEILKMLNMDKKWCLCMEMFERDVQNTLSSYLKGAITEEEFLKNARPWPNYKSDYRPLVEYAKKHKIPVCASNIPRKEANLVAKGGKAVLDSLVMHSPYADFKVFTDDSLYRVRFYKTLDALKHSRTKMRMGSIMKENFFLAQCLKDAVMAGSIMEWLNKGYSVFHVNGFFHSDFHSGIVHQLKKQQPDLKILTIKVLPVNEPLEIDAADVIILKKI